MSETKIGESFGGVVIFSRMGFGIEEVANVFGLEGEAAGSKTCDLSYSCRTLTKQA